MWNPKQLDELVQQLLDSIPPGIRAIPREVEKNFKTILQGALSKLDVVTREEFDAQVAALEQTRRLLAELEQKLQTLCDRYEQERSS